MTTTTNNQNLKTSPRNASNGQQGFVALVTVLFFVVLISVLTIGFLRITTQDQEQVLEDDLTKGALSAAESGVEDAKRAIMLCRSLGGAEQASCYAQLGVNQCPGIFSLSGPSAEMRSLVEYNTDGTVRVGGSEKLNQRTTCTVVSLQTRDYVSQASEEGEFVPLRPLGEMNSFKIEWHNSQLGDGVVGALPRAADANKNYSLSDWQSKRFPAMMRVQVVQFTPPQTLDDLTNKSAGVFLSPYGNASTGNVNLDAGGNLATAANQRANAQCQLSGSTYACSATIRVPVSTGKQYYARVSSIYGTPHYRITMQNGLSPVSFDNVQPAIDVTGAAGDVYRRIISRVSYAGGLYPGSSVESGMSLCKDFLVKLEGSGADSGCLGL